MSVPLTLVPNPPADAPTNLPPAPLPAAETRIALRLGEAAEAISVCRATLWRLLRAGEIPVVQIGGMKRILRRDLEAWLEAHKQP